MNFQNTDNFRRYFSWLTHAVATLLLLAWISGTFLYFHYRMIAEHETMKIRLIDYLCPSFINFPFFPKEGESFSEKDLHKYIVYFHSIYNEVSEWQAESITATLYALSGQDAESIASFKHVLSENPDFFWACYNLGIIYFRQGNFKEATDMMARALASDTTKTLVAITSSRAYMQLIRRHPDTGTYVLLAANVNKACLNAQRILVASSYWAGDFDNTLQAAAAFLENNNPNDPHLIYWRNITYLKLANKNDVLKELSPHQRLKNLQATPFQFF
jgi:hypothetical protein